MGNNGQLPKKIVNSLGMDEGVGNQVYDQVHNQIERELTFVDLRTHPTQENDK